MVPDKRRETNTDFSSFFTLSPSLCSFCVSHPSSRMSAFKSQSDSEPLATITGPHFLPQKWDSKRKWLLGAPNLILPDSLILWQSYQFICQHCLDHWWTLLCPTYLQAHKKKKVDPLVLFVCLFVFGIALGMWKFPGQGSNPCHRSNPSHCSDNTGSLTCCTTRECLCMFLSKSKTWRGCVTSSGSSKQ